MLISASLVMPLMKLGRLGFHRYRLIYQILNFTKQRWLLYGSLLRNECVLQHPASSTFTPMGLLSSMAAQVGRLRSSKKSRATSSLPAGLLVLYVRREGLMLVMILSGML